MKPQQLRVISKTRAKMPTVWDLILITGGCVLMALGFRLFLNENHIVSGGVVGLSTLIQKLTGWEPALFQWVVNLLLLGVGFACLGRSEGARSAYGSLVLPLAILLTRNVEPITHEPLLAAIFGSLVYGCGLGLVLQGRGSVGGYSLLARIAVRHLPISLSGAVFVLDAITIAASARVFGFEMAMYGLIGAFVMRRSLDAILLGLGRSVMAFVITTEEEAVKQRVLVELDRGLTVLPGIGGFTGTNRNVLMIVMSQAEAPFLRKAVKECDPHAFIVLTEASEVLGRGFGGG